MRIRLLLIVFAAYMMASCSSGDEVYYPQSMDDLTGHNVAIMEGSVQADYAQAHLMDKGISFFYYPSITDCMLSVKQGKTDVYFGNDLITFNEAFREQHLRISYLAKEIYAPAAYGVKKGRPELLSELNACIDSLEKCGSLKEINERWLDPSNTDFHDTYRYEPIPANPSNTEKVLKVGVSGIKPPSTIMIDNKWTGNEIEILQIYAQSKGIELSVATYDFHNLIPALKSDAIDIAVSTLIISDERKEKIDFTHSHITMNTAFIVNDYDYSNDKSLWKRIAVSAEASLIKDQRWKLITDGLLTTVIITLCSLILGSVLGGLVCALKMSRRRWKRKVADIYIYIMRNTPMLVLLMIMFYVVLSQSGLSPVVIAIIAFSLNSAAFISEIYRTGIQTVDKGQKEAGRALGCSSFKTFKYIVAPQAAKRAFPVFKSESITLLKGTSIVGYISIIDLTKASDLIRSASFEAFFPLIVITLIYFILSSILTILLDRLIKLI